MIIEASIYVCTGKRLIVILAGDTCDNMCVPHIQLYMDTFVEDTQIDITAENNFKKTHTYVQIPACTVYIEILCIYICTYSQYKYVC